jgi:hypothetical protein
VITAHQDTLSGQRLPAPYRLKAPGQVLPINRAFPQAVLEFGVLDRPRGFQVAAPHRGGPLVLVTVRGHCG